jgi:hypothetical protein
VFTAMASYEKGCGFDSSLCHYARIKNNVSYVYRFFSEFIVKCGQICGEISETAVFSDVYHTDAMYIMVTLH